MKKEPRIVLVTIVLNEEVFIQPQLTQHIDWPGVVAWIWVEGATGLYAERHSDSINTFGLSVDKTSELLQRASRIYSVDSAKRNHHPIVYYIPFGFSDDFEKEMGDQKAVLRNVYCEICDEINPDILVVIDADEFYTSEDQLRINKLVKDFPAYDAWILRQRHIWRPSSIQDNSLFDLEVIGGYWNISHCRIWRWKRGSRYFFNHNLLHYPYIKNDKIKYFRYTIDEKSVVSLPECIHLGFARELEHRKRTNDYYVYRGEGQEPKGRNRQMYVDCRKAWEDWQPGDTLPHGAKIISYVGSKIDVF